MSVFEEWLARKLDRGCTLREKRTVDEKYFVCLGPRNQFAFVVLTGEPWETFEYRSKAEWPLDAAGNERTVLNGILDELLTNYANGYLVTKARFTLDAIKYHEVDSSPNAFYKAARMAVKKIVEDNVTVPVQR
jgi:translation elongation factor EF-G